MQAGVAAGQRTDIQWLRALAVGLVLVYHFWPRRLPGGFVGVDVFFVISGFLITGHLLARPPRGIADVVQFWGRRVRRLLPAALTVVVLTLIGVLVFLPPTQWFANGQSGLASALYVQNWNLANAAVDYLAADQAPTALQHYWSLSVEEQFYLIWPLLFALGTVLSSLATKTDVTRRIAVGIILIVFVSSLAYSFLFTRINPSEAYFVTPTRMWELAAGGLLAVGYPILAERLRPFAGLRLSLVASGMALMIGTGFLLTDAAFPGWVALFPVAGALLVIGAGPADYRWSFDRLLATRPFQFLGDTSYSIYLWHWPFALFVPAALARPMIWVEKLVVIGAVVALSGLSKKHIEDRFRGDQPLGKPLRRTFVFLLSGTLLAGAAGSAVMAAANLRTEQEAHTSDQAILQARCLGVAAVLDTTCSDLAPYGGELLVGPLDAAEDRNDAYTDNCWWMKTSPTKYPSCQYGAESASAPEVALFGNSHAGPWLTPLQTLADKHEFRIRTYLASECYPSTMPIAFDDPEVTRACEQFTEHAMAQMRERGTKLAVMSVRVQSAPLADVPPDDEFAVLERMESGLLADLVAAGISVLVIRDVPFPLQNPIDCLATNLRDVPACDSPRARAVLADPLYDAAVAADAASVRTIDFTDVLCDSARCFSVVGGLVVYFNRGHLTATFARTFYPYLERPVLSALRS